MNKKLSSVLLTIVILLIVSGFGYILYKFPNETLSVIIGIICLMFVRHTYVAVSNVLDGNV
jgi:MFS superfamily sulfate permease-like transporter